MAGHLLLVILMYSFHELKAQVLLPPKLTVNPAVITETDSVTLNCQTPPSVSVTQCYFYTLNGGTTRVQPCLQTLTGTELLQMAHQRLPATVGLQCYYKAILGETNAPSKFSDTTFVTIQILLPPKLTVNPPVITETDSVTLNCQTPPSVSLNQCYFYTEGTIRVLSCLQTLTGTELLQMAHQRSPAEIKIKCYYTVKRGETNSPSPHSDTTSIVIQTLLPPKLTVNPAVITETDSVTLNCQTPPSVSVTDCYFRIREKPAKIFSCLKNLSGTELLKITNQSPPAEVKVKCFYLDTSSSPDSDESSIIIRTSLPPKLTVNPAVITETDSVTLNCQTPPSVSVTQCYFYTLSGGTIRVLSCLQTLTGTELLQMAHQSSPAEIKMKCYYTVKRGETNSPSPHSDTSFITIQRTVRDRSCLQTLTGTELLQMAHQRSPAEIKIKCYYTVKHGETNSPSPHSDTTSIMIQSAAENNERKTDLTTSISTTTSPVGGGDEGAAQPKRANGLLPGQQEPVPVHARYV
ncbi:flocculation protein FLO11-like isoform X4 [Scomber scombrus]|uniref:Flocculation protein FLO11-like isoform X4 n=1 Tax=Scomber scombrus TaxID=13677 RepID=A0AAV1N7J3_SCOSC